VDIVFANAGVAGRTPTGAADEALFENIVDTNLSAAFFTVKSSVALLNDNGSIIFNGSVHNYLGQAGQAAYAATKGGVVSMARVIATELAPRNIRVNVVAPGWTKTPIWKRGPRANVSAEESAKLTDFYSSVIPLGRWGEAEEQAKAVLFLASDDSSYINAIELVVDRRPSHSLGAGPRVGSDPIPSGERTHLAGFRPGCSQRLSPRRPPAHQRRRPALALGGCKQHRHHRHQGFAPGRHKVTIDLVDANHQLFPGQSITITFTMPQTSETH
jgi:hypothetical protein